MSSVKWTLEQALEIERRERFNERTPLSSLTGPTASPSNALKKHGRRHEPKPVYQKLGFLTISDGLQCAT